MYTIITRPLIPVRQETDERSEMISQLLFGEQIEILETKDNWYRVKNLTDNYEGWIAKRTLDIKNFHQTPTDTANFEPTTSPLTTCTRLSDASKIMLPGGSKIPTTNNTCFNIGNETYQIAKGNNILKSQNIIDLAKQYLNAPYLWGGKSLFGIDCSGFSQIIFSMLGISLPRDASQQVNEGTTIDFLSEAKAGDLAFFGDQEGSVSHVGILINNHQIIHASGWVKIDIIDSLGIFSSDFGEYTHNLRIIKRIKF